MVRREGKFKTQLFFCGCLVETHVLDAIDVLFYFSLGPSFVRAGQVHGYRLSFFPFFFLLSSFFFFRADFTVRFSASVRECVRVINGKRFIEGITRVLFIIMASTILLLSSYSIQVAMPLLICLILTMSHDQTESTMDNDLLAHKLPINLSLCLLLFLPCCSSFLSPFLLQIATQENKKEEKKQEEKSTLTPLL